MRWVLLGVLLLVLAYLGYLAYLGAVSRRPKTVGPRDGDLRPCRRASNCVCSRPACGGDAVAPLPLVDDPETMLERVAAAVADWPRTRVITRRGGYLHLEQRSRWFGFVDDLELLADPGEGVLHVRAGSRVGISDRGVNRRRVERLRGALAAPPGPPAAGPAG